MYHTTAFPSSEEGAVTLRTALKPGDVGTIIYLPWYHLRPRVWI